MACTQILWYTGREQNEDLGADLQTDLTRV